MITSRSGVTPFIEMTVGNNPKRIILPRQNLPQFMTNGEEISEEFLNFQYTWRFMLGPFPIGVTLGISGSAGLKNYWVGLRPLVAKSQVTPFVKAELFASAGIDAILVSVKPQIKITLLEQQTTLSGESSLKLMGYADPVLWEEYSAGGELKALGGSVSIRLCVDFIVSERCRNFWTEEWDGVALDRQTFIPLKQKGEKVRGTKPPVK